LKQGRDGGFIKL